MLKTLKNIIKTQTKMNTWTEKKNILNLIQVYTKTNPEVKKDN